MARGRIGMEKKVTGKRGQVTVFVIIGLLLFILVVLLFWFRDSSGFRVPFFVDAGSHANAIERDIARCVDSNLEPGVVLLGSQGGLFNPQSYRLYEGKKVGYVCEMNGDKCINYLPTRDGIRQEIVKYMEFSFENCLDRSLLESGGGIEVENNGMKTGAELRGDSVRFTVTPDVVVSKGENSVRVGRVVRVVNYPMGELYDVAHSIVQDLSKYGEFEQLFYMLDRKGNYIINVDKPYPDIVYIINKKDSGYKFYIAVKGA